VSLRPLILLVPPYAQGDELRLRLAATGRALAGVYAFEPLTLAQALAEPGLLGRGLRVWERGHDRLLAAGLLADADWPGISQLPPRPLAAALTRTLVALRNAVVAPQMLAALAARPAPSREDGSRLAALASLYGRYRAAVDEHAADAATIFAAAREALPAARWLKEAQILIPDDLELESVAADFVAALAAAHPTVILRRPIPPSLRASSFRAQFAERGVEEADWSATRLAPLAPAEPPASLQRLRESLFEPPAGGVVADDAVELVTAPGEAAEVRAVARRLLREAARGVRFEEMGVILPQPDPYAPLFTDLLSRLQVPHRLHPSLPLRFSRSARSLLLLFRCRGLERPAVMELLTFAPVRFELILGEAQPRPARWDWISRDARIVSGHGRWIVGLRAWAQAEKDAAAGEQDGERREQRARNAADAETLLKVVDQLSATLDGLAGQASWAEWVELLRTACELWVGPEQDPNREREREKVLEVIADLGALGSASAPASWDEVEQVIEEELERRRLPRSGSDVGAVHVGALDAMAGLPFRVVAIPGLVEGGYPGVFRQDPFLLDDEREALRAPTPSLASEAVGTTLRRGAAQLELFPPLPTPVPRPAGGHELPTSQDRLLEARRQFHRALSQACERLILSYPRADARSGGERLPSLFFAAAASALAGHALAGAELDRLVVEDALERLPLEDALDPGERDRIRLLRDSSAANAIAGGSAFFRQSRLASEARWSGRLTRYDGLVGELEEPLQQRLDPLRARFPVSASRLATYSRCGFQYLLQHVLRLQPQTEPEERRRLDPLERGDLFHQVAERFLRERREHGELPLAESDSARERLRQIAEEALERLLTGSLPRFTLLWEREKSRFHDTLQQWLSREIAAAGQTTPIHFELSFGLGRPADGDEPHDPAPLGIDLGDGRTLLVSGRIDRIDRRAGGGLVLRDYKTGRAPRDEGGVFRGGRQLQIPFYVLAAAKLFPGEVVVDAFLDYVDGGRQVAFRPELARSDAFRALLRDLVGLIARGVYVQEPAGCDYCDFTAVCGPKPLLARRQAMKLRDPALQGYLRLRDVG
jgi:RecB family exonuclease